MVCFFSRMVRNDRMHFFWNKNIWFYFSYEVYLQSYVVNSYSQSFLSIFYMQENFSHMIAFYFPANFMSYMRNNTFHIFMKFSYMRLVLVWENCKIGHMWNGLVRKTAVILRKFCHNGRWGSYIEENEKKVLSRREQRYMPLWFEISTIR